MRSLQIYSCVLILGVLTSCGGGTTDKQPNETKVKKEVSEKNFEFKELDFDKSVLSKLKGVKGDFKHGRRWQDANGDNVLVFTFKQVFKSFEDAEYDDMGEFTRYLKAYHFSSNDRKNYKLMRLIQDFNQNPCASPPFALDGDFYEKSISITNVDNDEYGEATFMYFFNCASEINPSDVKLMLIENGEKYPIRGNQYIREYYPDSGVKNIGKEFNNAPKAILSHASKTWEKICPSNPDL